MPSWHGRCGCDGHGGPPQGPLEASPCQHRVLEPVTGWGEAPCTTEHFYKTMEAWKDQLQATDAPPPNCQWDGLGGRAKPSIEALFYFFNPFKFDELKKNPHIK